MLIIQIAAAVALLCVILLLEVGVAWAVESGRREVLSRIRAA
jgi:hypothetical protein